MSRVLNLLRRATLADVAVLLGVAGLASALLFPLWKERVFQSRVTAVIAEVDSLTEAARSARLASGFWPETAPGEAPAPGEDAPNGQTPGSRDGYTLGWTTWEVVDSIEPRLDSATGPPAGGTSTDLAPLLEPVPRTVGAVSVRTGEEALLAELLAHFGDQASFVIDSVWLFVLPERSPSPEAQ